VSGIAALRSFARRRLEAARCELCGAPLATVHEHLAESTARTLRCACHACALLFEGGPAGRLRRVRRRVEPLPGFRLSDAAWRALGVPVDVAFFLARRAPGDVVALCPGAAGVVQAGVDRAAWAALAATNPVLAELEPDIEGLLVSRLGGTRACYRATVDECYRLAGLVRGAWHGLSGGPDAWRAIEDFFAELRR
jgi:hypothetical protein